MGMPWQLAQAKRPKRSEPRPLVEQLPRIDVGDLTRLKVFPNDMHTRRSYEVAFRYPFLKTLTVSHAFIEANHHSGYNQRIGLKWIRTGFGGAWKPRPLLICRCGRATRKVYLRHGSLGCRRCHDATYASRTVHSLTRPALQVKRLHTFLELKTHMKRTERQRLEARCRALQAKTKPTYKLSKRLDHKVTLPHSNYLTQGAMHWR